MATRPEVPKGGGKKNAKKKKAAAKNEKSEQIDDWSLWKSVAESVRPLPGKEVSPPAPPPKPRDEKAQDPDRAPRAPSAAAPVPEARRHEPELRAGVFAGLDKRTAQRLKRGQLPIEARIDLHHMTQAEAHHALNDFIGGAAAAGKRTVLVITGKGLKPTGEVGVLRTMVPRWLNQPPLRGQIVAFCEAAPKDGGSGALYLRLRKFV